jgi:hypothetical protein
VLVFVVYSEEYKISWARMVGVIRAINTKRVINTTELRGITSDNLVASMGSKIAAVDVFALGFVVSLPFPKYEGDGSVSFLVCMAEFVPYGQR